jgi:glycine hydroxymethyltransferase
LKKFDPVVFKIIKNEEDRQERSIALIASENFTSKAVLQALGTVM